ncbi:hypothetical protein SKAU_G00297610 [Synaphobranchus kaupii]|uniref:Uncharacterized protein n=1 Tax=Synaphobranchus kaupii TaxID=118154 RepID=A0A9Q1IMY2_SYNKA|nr:hypothetical protein SKAU_G00297610 [Synaphobranchus kaupii]
MPSPAVECFSRLLAVNQRTPCVQPETLRGSAPVALSRHFSAHVTNTPEGWVLYREWVETTSAETTDEQRQQLTERAVPDPTAGLQQVTLDLSCSAASRSS